VNNDINEISKIPRVVFMCLFAGSLRRDANDDEADLHTAPFNSHSVFPSGFGLLHLCRAVWENWSSSVERLWRI